MDGRAADRALMKGPELDQGLLQALRHPLRRRLLVLYVEEGERLSPKELALVTRQHLSRVAYHVRTLAAHGALVLVHEEAVRGTVEHFYKPTALVRETAWVRAALGLPAAD